jgi:hypothetical protein
MWNAQPRCAILVFIFVKICVMAHCHSVQEITLPISYEAIQYTAPRILSASSSGLNNSLDSVFVPFRRFNKGALFTLRRDGNMDSYRSQKAAKVNSALVQIISLSQFSLLFVFDIIHY